MKKSIQTKEIKIVKKKIIPRMSDEEIKDKKIHDLLKMFESYPDTKLTFWKDLSGRGDIMGTVPIYRTTIKIIGGMFNPHEIKKDEQFVKFYVIDVIGSIKNNLSVNIDEKKKNYLEEQGIMYLKGFNINQLFEDVINKQ